MTKAIDIIYIDRAADCTINMFMSCMYDHNLQALVVSGEPMENELLEAFEKIVVEYSDMAGLTDKTTLAVEKKVEKLRAKVLLIEVCLSLQHASILHFGAPNARAQVVLRSNGINLKWDEKSPDKDDFVKQIKKARTRSKTNDVLLEEEEFTLNLLYKEQAAKLTKPGNERKNFMALLVTLPTAGYYINRDHTTLEELATMVRLYDEQNEQFRTHESKRAFVR